MAAVKENKTIRRDFTITPTEFQRLTDARFAGRFKTEAELLREGLRMVCDKVLGPEIADAE